MDYILALLLPPLAVLMKGKPGQAGLNLILCLFGWIPGIIHALLVVSQVKADQRTQKVVDAINRKQNT